MIRQQVKQPYQLQGKSGVTDRRRENHVAIGGMKNPRVSLHKVPGHRKVGADVAGIIDAHMEQRPEMLAKILAAIGDTTKNNKGPSHEEVRVIARKLEMHVNIIGYDPAQYRTQLRQPLCEAWVR